MVVEEGVVVEVVVVVVEGLVVVGEVVVVEAVGEVVALEMVVVLVVAFAAVVVAVGASRMCLLQKPSKIWSGFMSPSQQERPGHPERPAYHQCCNTSLAPGSKRMVAANHRHSNLGDLL
jgi:hypothetical protein